MEWTEDGVDGRGLRTDVSCGRTGGVDGGCDRAGVDLDGTVRQSRSVVAACVLVSSDVPGAPHPFVSGGEWGRGGGVVVVVGGEAADEGDSQLNGHVLSDVRLEKSRRTGYLSRPLD